MNSKELARRAFKRGALQKIGELSALISLLKRRRLKVLVEIGTAHGGTLYTWCRIANTTALIICIDMPHGPFGGGFTLKEMGKFKTYARKKQRVKFLRKDSRILSTKKALIKLLGGQQIDFLFIDGDHRYKGVKRDWQLYSPLVKENGIIALHDVLFHPDAPKCKVDKLWKEIRGGYHHREFVTKEDPWGWGQWGGIGVIYYKRADSISP